MEKERSKNMKFIQGRVVSDKMDKTRVVLIESRKRHSRFKKLILRSRKVKIHDEKNTSAMGDLINAIETRPLSKDKHYRLFKILEKAK